MLCFANHVNCFIHSSHELLSIPPAKDLFRRSNSEVVTSPERNVLQTRRAFDVGQPSSRHLPLPPYSPSPPPSRLSSHFYASRPRGPGLSLENSDQRPRPSSPSQSPGARRLRTGHPRPDLLRLRNVLHERQLSLPTRGDLRDRLPQDEGSNESDDDTLSSGLSGYYPPPPEPAPPDFIPSNYRSHQQELMRERMPEEDGGAAAAAGTATDSRASSCYRLFICRFSPVTAAAACPSRLFSPLVSAPTCPF